MNTKIWSLFLVVAACGGGGDGSFSGSVDSPAEFCRGVAQTGCQAMYDCLTQAERDAKHLPPTEAECERALAASCNNVVDGCADSTHAYSADVAGQCIDDMQASTCIDASQPWLGAKSCDSVCALTQGKFEVAWTFSPSYHSCSDTGVTTVSVISVGPGGKTYVDSFDCFSASGITDVLPVGAYNVHVELYDSSNRKLWASPSVNGKLDDDLVDLGTITIPVSGG